MKKEVKCAHRKFPNGSQIVNTRCWCVVCLSKDSNFKIKTQQITKHKQTSSWRSKISFLQHCQSQFLLQRARPNATLLRLLMKTSHFFLVRREQLVVKVKMLYVCVCVSQPVRVREQDDENKQNGVGWGGGVYIVYE